MKIFAISDLHLDHAVNRRALEELPAHPEDWLILAGDTGHQQEQLEMALELLGPRYKQLVWVPGNHELWTETRGGEELRGEAKYQRLVEICRRHGVLTPEDPFREVETEEGRMVIAPLFLLYDYSFQPEGLARAAAVAWAAESGIVCTDEIYLHSDPYPSVESWCAARCERTARLLEAVPRELPLILINHFPLRRDLVHIRIPRFIIWCGTRRTEQWHQRFKVGAVVQGHLHVRTTQWRDGIRFEEVSLGYPRQWSQRRGIASYLRQIWPAPRGSSPEEGLTWYR